MTRVAKETGLVTQMGNGVHGDSSHLFRFDPKVSRVEVLDRITSIPSIPSKRSGMYDQFSYRYQASSNP